MLPGVTGVELHRQLRSTGSKILMILLTAKDEVGDRATGLDARADDDAILRLTVTAIDCQHQWRICLPNTLYKLLCISLKSVSE